MIIGLKDQVKKVLIDNPETRNSDITLTIEIWKKFYSVGDNIPVGKLYDLPREDNVKRIRAKFCEQGYSWAMPTEEKIAKQRKINADIWRKALGYKTIDKSNVMQYRVLNPDGSVDKVIDIIN